MSDEPEGIEIKVKAYRCPCVRGHHATSDAVKRCILKQKMRERSLLSKHDKAMKLREDVGRVVAMRLKGGSFQEIAAALHRSGSQVRYVYYLALISVMDIVMPDARLSIEPYPDTPEGRLFANFWQCLRCRSGKMVLNASDEIVPLFELHKAAVLDKHWGKGLPSYQEPLH